MFTSKYKSSGPCGVRQEYLCKPISLTLTLTIKTASTTFNGQRTWNDILRTMTNIRAHYYNIYVKLHLHDILSCKDPDNGASNVVWLTRHVRFLPLSSRLTAVL